MRYELRPRIRIVDGDGTIVLGPGKADLLDAIARTGSIRAAAAELGMSYMRAWTLVKTMNAAFRAPLVEKERGGAAQGGAQLTPRERTSCSSIAGSKRKPRAQRSLYGKR